MYDISPAQCGYDFDGTTPASIVLPTCKSVYIGTAGTYDFYMKNDPTDETSWGWVPFICVSGSVIPIKARGARANGGAKEPTTTQVIFLYD